MSEVGNLGAAVAVDYHSGTAIDELVAAIGDGPLAGVLAVARGSVVPAVAIARRASGPGRVAADQPALMTRIQLLWSRSRGVSVSAIWGGTLKDNEVGPGIFADFLPAALAAGSYLAAPEAVVVGEGLEQIPAALERLRQGVSVEKHVVRI